VECVERRGRVHVFNAHREQFGSGLLGLGAYPLGGEGVVTPNDDHEIGFAYLPFDLLAKILTADKLSIPPNLKACVFKLPRQCCDAALIGLRVRDEKLGHGGAEQVRSRQAPMKIIESWPNIGEIARLV
jgi:hypothetical protein